MNIILSLKTSVIIASNFVHPIPLGLTIKLAISEHYSNQLKITKNIFSVCIFTLKDWKVCKEEMY